MMRPFALLLAAALGLQPALADGLTPKAKRELCSCAMSLMREATWPGGSELGPGDTRNMRVVVAGSYSG
ncbi:MAG: hypothetical protein E5W19_14055, partial [Mesorhizobium sp.]